MMLHVYMTCSYHNVCMVLFGYTTNQQCLVKVYMCIHVLVEVFAIDKVLP